MIVYLVTAGEYSEYHIEAVFSTSVAAEQYAEQCEESEVKEWEVDSRAGWIARQSWQSCAYPGGVAPDPTAPVVVPQNRDGEIMMAPPKARSMIRHRGRYDYWFVTSFISPEHANEVAQKVLKHHDKLTALDQSIIVEVEQYFTTVPDADSPPNPE